MMAWKNNASQEKEWQENNAKHQTWNLCNVRCAVHLQHFELKPVRFGWIYFFRSLLYYC